MVAFVGISDLGRFLEPGAVKHIFRTNFDAFGAKLAFFVVNYRWHLKGRLVATLTIKAS